MAPRANRGCEYLWSTLFPGPYPSGHRLSERQDVQLVERGVEGRLVRDHRLHRFESDDARRLDDRGDERGGDVRRDRGAALRRALGRQPVEAELAQAVIQPL